MSQHSSNSLYEAARRGAAWLERTDRGRIVISGADRASYLHALLTNDVTALQPGRGVYATYLTPQGRMISDMWVYELGDVILMIVPRQTQQTVLARLDQFLFSEDVQLGDVTGTFAEISIVGPRSRDVVAALIGQRAGQALDDGPDHGLEPGSAASAASAVDALLEDGAARVTDGDGEPAILVRTSDLGEPGYSLLVAEARKGRFVDALGRAGVAALDAETADTLRIEGGIPRFGTDMDEETIPLEAGIESRAISLTKGCYVGQEVIVRVLHRGHGRVARRLVGLTLPPDATVPAAGVPVLGGERDLGRVTSASWSPRLERPIALAYVHRDFVAPGTTVTVDGREATVTALPFVEARRGEPADKRAR